MYEVRVFFIEMRLAESVIYQWRAPQIKITYIQSTTMYVPSSELGLSHPSLVSECAPSPGTKGGGDTRLRVRGWGSSNSDDFRKSVALCGELAR
jgi:hypothetical protein